MNPFRGIVASFVVAGGCLLLPSSPQAALAEEPIQKAFGQTLGAVFDQATSTQSSGDIGHTTFFFPDPAKIPQLTEFFVTVTPVTYRIYGIFADGQASDQNTCIGTELSLFEIVGKKYSGDQYGGDMRQVKGKEEYFLIQPKTHRMVRVGCHNRDGQVRLEMAYVDETIRDDAKSEEQELGRLRADLGAKNYAQVVPRLQELARQGNLWAETTLGYVYGHGYGVPRDEDTAEDYYLRAAQRGYLGAEFNLGVFYQDRFRYKPAEVWLLKAAEREMPEAEENLGQLYLAKGPLRSDEKSFQWFLRAAEHGQPESQYNTCYAYADGLGVGRDMIEAYKWCYIAARNGQAQADRNKDHLAAQMRPDDVAKGRTEAEQWLAKENSAKQ
jgi:TPR repeat protein